MKKTNNDVSVLVYSCDAYSDVWKPFFVLFFRYWNCPYDVYITTETCKCQIDNVTTINTNGNKWTDRIRKAVEQIQTKYIIGMCEDMFFRKPVRQNIINKCIDYMNKDETIACFNFEKGYSKTKQGKYPDFGCKIYDHDYQKSCQPTLWRKDILLDLLKESQQPWEWETSDTQIKNDFYVWTGSKDDLVFEYGYHDNKWFGIQKGKWVISDVEPLFQKENINVDFTKRGFI